MNTHIEMEEKKQDKGFTLVELLIVIVILGILATVTVFAVRGITDQGKQSACQADLKTLETATETWVAKFGNAANISHTVLLADALWVGSPAAAAVAVPTATPPVTFAAGATPMATLVNAGFLRSPGPNFAVAPDGDIYYKTAVCGTINTLASAAS
jgi:prepilin-type N-terminal cleavage/methylation domain-containing protein